MQHFSTRSNKLCLSLLILLVAGPLRAEVPPVVTMPNGMRLSLRERHSTSLVAIDLWVRAGAREERNEERGCAHFLEHLLFKGTDTYKAAGQVDIAIENLGGALNAATGADYVHFYTTVVRSRVPQALGIVADIVRHATLPEQEMARERGVILDEVAQHVSTPEALAVDLLYASALRNLPYSHSPGGTPDTISMRGRDTLAEFYHRLYRPERCTLVLVGDLTPPEGTRWANDAFGDWKTESGPVAGLPPTAPPPIHGEQAISTARVISVSPTEWPAVGIAFPAPPASDRVATAAAMLMAEIIEGADRLGRLTTETATSGQPMEVSCRFTPRQDPGLWMLLVVLPTHAKPASSPEDGKARAQAEQDIWERRLRNTTGNLFTHPPSQTELAQARLRLLNRLTREQESNSGLAAAVGYGELTGGDGPELLRSRLMQINLVDLQSFAQTFLTRPLAVCDLQAAPAKNRHASEIGAGDSNTQNK